MAGKRIDIRQIGELLHVSGNTVNSYCRLLDGLKLALAHLLAMDDSLLKELCAPESQEERSALQPLNEILFIQGGWIQFCSKFSYKYRLCFGGSAVFRYHNLSRVKSFNLKWKI